MSAALYIVGSQNRKLSADASVDCTFASIEASCPKSCKLKDESCYAQLSFVGLHGKRLDNYAINLSLSPEEVAREEALAIDNSYKSKAIKNKLLRIHVAGDARTKKAVSLINNAVKRWKKRGRGKGMVIYPCLEINS